MSCCCCLKPSLRQNSTTTQENQTFTASEQDVAAHSGAQLNGACSLTSDPVNPCPAPTEHRLSWSHATHSPSVASSTLLDPEGQAFAKHYNPLLSGETSHGSQHSSDKQLNAIMFRRFGEPIQTNSQSLPSSCMTGQSSEHSEHEAIGQYTAPSGQAMQAADCTSTSVTPQSLRQHGPSMADQVLFGPALLPSFDAQEPTDQTDKQSRFRKQLDDALKLRSWKGKQSQSSGSTDPPDQLPDGQLSLTPASQPVQKTVALSLSPGPESVLLVAASELGFDAEHDSNLRLPQPKGPVQPLSHTIVPARSIPTKKPVASAFQAPLSGPPQSAASNTMLQSMTARAASFRADSMQDTYSPPSPMPSIDRFSSTSSWGGSSASPSSMLNNATLSGVKPQGEDSHLKAQPSRASLGLVNQLGGQRAQHSSGCVSAMRAMHDSSSSWTDAPEGGAASKQQTSATASKPVLIQGQSQPQLRTQTPGNCAVSVVADADEPAMPHVVEAKGCAAVLIAENGVSEQKINQSFSAQGLMHGPQIDSKQTAKEATLSAASKKVFDAAAAPTPAPEEAVSAIPAGVPKITAVPTHVPGAGVTPTPSLLAVQVHGSSNPKQTLAEMAAWLDAQLAAAPGKKPSQAANISDDVKPLPVGSQSVLSNGSTAAAPPLAVALDGIPPILPNSQGLLQNQLPSTQLLSKAASAPGVIGRIISQTRSKPTGLPLARKGSGIGSKAAGKLPAGHGKGSDLSVSEMMQWLDSKLAQAMPAQPVTCRPSPTESSRNVATLEPPTSTSPQANQSCDQPLHVQSGADQAAYDNSSASSPLSPPLQETEAAARVRPVLASSVTTVQDAHTQPNAVCNPQSTASAQVSATASAAACQDTVSTPSAVTEAVALPSSLAGNHTGGSVVTQLPSSTAALTPAQTAAEVLEWLDATLAVKKPASTNSPVPGPIVLQKRPNTNFKAAADTAVGAAMGKQQPSRNSQTQMMKNAGTGDMLAWLDAKIAAQKASLVG